MNPLKVKTNKIIDAQNAKIDDIKIPRIVGEYHPGYIYGNVKIHKNGVYMRKMHKNAEIAYKCVKVHTRKWNTHFFIENHKDHSLVHGDINN